MKKGYISHEEKWTNKFLAIVCEKNSGNFTSMGLGNLCNDAKATNVLLVSTTKLSSTVYMILIM